MATRLPGFNTGRSEGGETPPIIVDGIVYVAMGTRRVVAFNANDGKVVWTYDPPKLAFADVQKNQPIATGTAHLHYLYYADGLIYLYGLDCSFVALNALSGKEEFSIKEMCKDIPGNAGYYTGGYGSPPFIYKKGGVLIWVSNALDGNNGRGFVSGYDMKTKQLKWRWFISPPAGGDPDWAVRDAAKGNIAPYKGDWGDMGAIMIDGKLTPRAGCGSVWGHMAVDEETGMVYFGTSQPSSDWNATFRPGPNLYCDSIIGLNANNGELAWYFQTTPHDLYDYDCAWNTVLGKANIGGTVKKVVYKACKNGGVYALDAATGKLVWQFLSDDIKFSPYLPSGIHNALYTFTGKYDPVAPWGHYPSKATTFYNPPGTGGIEADIAYDGKAIFVASHNKPTFAKIGPIDKFAGLGRLESGLVSQPPPFTPKLNTTIHALDAVTGKEKWRYFIDGAGYRGGVIASAGLLYVSSLDGNLYVFDAETGKIVTKKLFGFGLGQQPTLGATTKGEMRLFLNTGGLSGSSWGNPAPGALMVFGLGTRPEPQVITKEVIKEVPKEVIKEVPKEVVKTVTVETISPITYIGIAVGVIGIVIAIVAGRRSRKQA
jgi:alcohol dehydrogenase (cytochrome c)/quinohemoprotein ethanol dehydrogenase